MRTTDRQWLWPGMLCLLLSIACVAIGDTTSMANLSKHDFCLSFYTAGHMLRMGEGRNLYPPPQANWQTLPENPLDAYAHKLMPELKMSQPIVFIYPPIASLVFAPFSFLPVRLALVVWQLTTFLALSASAFLASRFGGTGWRPFLSSFTLLPVLQSFLLGQPTILFAFLPLAAGYILWKQNKQYTAGLVWSLLWLKAQILLPLTFVLFAWTAAAFCKRTEVGSFKEANLAAAAKVWAGIASGTIALFLLTCFCNSPESISNWLTTLSNFGPKFISNGGDYVYIFAGSLPVALNVFVGAEQQEVYKQAAQAAIGLAFILFFCLNLRLFSSRWHWSTKQDLAIILCLGALPVISPYLRIYDLQLFLLILWIFMTNSLPAGVSEPTRWFLIASWVGLDLYFCLCTWLPGGRYLLFAVLLVISMLYLRICLSVLKGLPDERSIPGATGVSNAD